MLSLGAAARAPADTFFVDRESPACNDAGPGSESVPYCTISAAIAAHNGAGVTIRVNPGVYPESVAIPKSGAAGNPFVLEASGPGVMLDGSDDFGDPALWTQFSGSVWVAPSVTWTTPQMVLSDGVRLVASAVAPASLPPGTFQYSGAGLYANVGGDNPGDHATYVGRRSGISGSGRSWIVIDGFTCVRMAGNGILVGGNSNAIVTDNVLDYCSTGIFATNCTNLLVARNSASNSAGQGIQLRDLRDSAIEDNVAYGNDAGIKLTIDAFQSTHNRLQRNRAYHNAGTGFYYAAGAHDNLSIQNCSWANGDHGYLHVAATGVRHIGDVAFGNTDDGFAFKDGSTGGGLANCISADNGIGDFVYACFVDSASIASQASNDNVFWTSNGQPPIRHGGTVYATLAAFVAASGLDTRSLEGDPVFVDPDLGDFQLQPQSPAIDCGNSSVADWPTHDAAGRVRVDDLGHPNTGLGPVAYADRGAFEFGAAALDVPGLAVAGDVLSPVAPNPMRAIGRFAYVLATDAPARVAVLDVQGRTVAVLADGAHRRGRHEATWDGRTAEGPAASGVYFLTLEAAGTRVARRFALLR